MTRRDKIAAAILFSLLFWAVLAVGAMDAQDAERERMVYCEFVADGTWPDFKGDYEERCK